jgi:hypothetical protein
MSNKLINLITRYILDSKYNFYLLSTDEKNNLINIYKQHHNCINKNECVRQLKSLVPSFFIK